MKKQKKRQVNILYETKANAEYQKIQQSISKESGFREQPEELN